MNTLIMMVVMFVAMLSPMLLVAGAVFWQRRRHRLEGRRSPINDKLVHLPGEQLRIRLAELRDKIEEHLVQVLLVGPVALLAVLLPRVQWASIKLSLLDWGVLATAVVVCVWNILKIAALQSEYRNNKDGVRAEVAVAQQLDRLQAQDCLVLHDIPVEGFNIDHVVIGASAVFAVETKSRRKVGEGKESANVTFDGKTLKFPRWAETRPLEQTRSQARWLSDYLSGETGEPVPVIPVLCLPGWYVQADKNAQQANVRVINPKMTSLFVDAGNRPRLQPAQRNRIVHALQKRYPALSE